MKHSLERTSPKGQEFIGTCRLCGTSNLSMGAVFEDCPNPRGLTEDESLIEAIEGPMSDQPLTECQKNARRNTNTVRYSSIMLLVLRGRCRLGNPGGR
jgi:hypothetical protein